MPPTIIFIITFPGGLYVTEGDPDAVYHRLAAGEDIDGYAVNHDLTAGEPSGPLRIDAVRHDEAAGYVLRVGPGFVLIYDTAARQ